MIRIDIEKALSFAQGVQSLKVAALYKSREIVGVTGPSGAGKTTLLKLIAGLAAPDTGLIAFNDEVWFDKTQRINLPPQQRKVGFVFQDYALFPNMTVMQHLEYATNDREWIDRLLRAGELQGLVTGKPLYLSGGQQQRLAILRALAIKPKLLLMDEPFSALDQKLKSTLINDVVSLINELGATAMIVSHNPQELSGITTSNLYVGEEM